MNTSRILKVSIIFTTILSVILYSAVLFQNITVMEFQDALFLLYPAEALSIITLIMIASLILIRKDRVSADKMKKPMIGLCTTIAVLCIILTCYAYLDCYNCYTPERLLESDKTYIQMLFPYHNIDDDKVETDVEVSHIPGTDYICLYGYGPYTSGDAHDYEIEYFKSKSPFMNFKFKSERTILTPLNEYDLDVIAPGEKITVDNVKLKVYVDEDNCAVFINKFDQAIYAYVSDMDVIGITAEDFAREVISQFEALETIVDDKYFLDIPLSESFAE